LGTEWLSGRSFDTEAGKNKSFSPLYGTNHLYNGFMDYFYFGTNYFNSFGLNDYYLKSTYKFNSNSNLQANFHAFTSNGKLGLNNLGEKIPSYLGTELDLVFTHKIGKSITANLGHSFMFSGKSMEYLKNVPEPKTCKLGRGLLLESLRILKLNKKMSLVFIMETKDIFNFINHLYKSLS
jgi:hypothetical protein